ncbi:MAG: hypothetical protein M3Y48_10270 [Actinomycetota bacterium]|nr:hypothetical protein [Actinomycetota bacterium]
MLAGGPNRADDSSQLIASMSSNTHQNQPPGGRWGRTLPDAGESPGRAPSTRHGLASPSPCVALWEATLQLDALTAAGAEKVFTDVMSGYPRRPTRACCVARLRARG